MARTRAAARRSIDRLPAEALEAVLARLPADSRARAACVSRAWRSAVACPKSWHELDLTRAGGLTCALGPAAILDAPSLAQRLVHVRVLRLPAGPDAPLEALRAVLRLLRDKTLSGVELRLEGALKPRALAIDGSNYGALLGALTQEPALTLITLDALHCSPELGATVFCLPRFSVPHVIFGLACAAAAAAPVERLLSALERYTPLTTLSVTNAPFTTQQLTRVVDVALARSLPKLELTSRSLGPDSVPELARLLRSSTSLRHLLVQGESYSNDAPLFNTANVALFSGTLRDTVTLKHLTLSNIGPSWRCAAPAVCSALAGHPTLESLLLWENVGQCVDLSTLDAALLDLLIADAPALQRLELNFSVSAYGQPSLTLPRTFDALARNTHLRALKIGALETSNALLRTALQAMQANTGLREATIVLNDDFRVLSATLLNQLHAAMSHMPTFERRDDVF